MGDLMNRKIYLKISILLTVLILLFQNCQSQLEPFSNASTNEIALASIEAPAQSEIGQEVVFSIKAQQAITNVNWSFPNGQTASGETIRLTFNTPGSMRYEAKVSLLGGSSLNLSATIMITEVGRSCVDFSDLSISTSNPVQGGAQFNVNENISLSVASVPACLNLDLNQVQWNFGDQSSNLNGGTVSHAYTQAGAYTVTATDLNSNESIQIRIDVAQLGSVITPSVQIPSNIIAGQSVEFVVEPEQSISQANWNIDGSTKSGTRVNHTFASAGNYSGSVVVTLNGQSTTQTLNFTVSVAAAGTCPQPSDLDISVSNSGFSRQVVNRNTNLRVDIPNCLNIDASRIQWTFQMLQGASGVDISLLPTPANQTGNPIDLAFRYVGNYLVTAILPDNNGILQNQVEVDFFPAAFPTCPFTQEQANTVNITPVSDYISSIGPSQTHIVTQENTTLTFSGINPECLGYTDLIEFYEFPRDQDPLNGRLFQGNTASILFNQNGKREVLFLRESVTGELLPLFLDVTVFTEGNLKIDFIGLGATQRDGQDLTFDQYLRTENRSGTGYGIVFAAITGSVQAYENDVEELVYQIRDANNQMIRPWGSIGRLNTGYRANSSQIDYDSSGTINGIISGDSRTPIFSDANGNELKLQVNREYIIELGLVRHGLIESNSIASRRFKVIHRDHLEMVRLGNCDFDTRDDITESDANTITDRVVNLNSIYSEVCDLDRNGVVNTFDTIAIAVIDRDGTQNQQVFLGYERGDCNADGVIDNQDNIFTQIILDRQQKNQSIGFDLKLCDCNGDGSLDASDITGSNNRTCDRR